MVTKKFLANQETCTYSKQVTHFKAYKPPKIEYFEDKMPVKRNYVDYLRNPDAKPDNPRKKDLY